jgi:hypothetical protein
MGGQADCFGDGKTYQTGGLYDTARGVTMHTIGIDNPYRPQANCNNWKQQPNVHTDNLDSDWTDMSLVPAPYHQYPQTFVYGFLCSGRDTVSGEDTSNSSAAQGWSYLSTLSVSNHQNNGFPQIYRVDQCTDPEMIWGSQATVVGGTTGYATSEIAMQNNCALHPQ